MYHKNSVARTPVFGIFLTRSDTNWAVPPLMLVRGLKVPIYEIEGLGYVAVSASMQKAGFHLMRLIRLLESTVAQW